MKLFFLFIILLIGAARLGLLFFAPSSISLAEINPSDFTYLAVLKNPVIHLLLCGSLILMCLGFICLSNNKTTTQHYLSQHNKIFYCFILILIVTMGGILWFHGSYIQHEFTKLLSVLIYEAYNPQSAPGLSYYQWKYSINPAKLYLSLLIIFPLIPFFVYLRLLAASKK